MKILQYFLEAAFKSMWQEKWVNLLTILSVSVGLSILSAFIMITLNMDSVVQRWSRSFGLVVYLENTITEEGEERLKNQLLQDPAILAVEYIPSDKALEDVRKTLGANAVILDNFSENPLPATFDIKVRNEFLEPAKVRQKAEEIKRMQGVNDVQYGDKWLASLNSISKSMKIIAVIFGCAIFMAVTFITYNTIKVFFYRRKEEIKTLKLLGATDTFTRLPFLIEGFSIGIAGGSISAIVMFGLSTFATLRIVELMPSISVMISPLPIQAYLIIPLAGAVMSVLGSFVAVGEIRY